MKNLLFIVICLSITFSVLAKKIDVSEFTYDDGWKIGYNDANYYKSRFGFNDPESTYYKNFDALQKVTSAYKNKLYNDRNLSPFHLGKYRAFSLFLISDSYTNPDSTPGEEDDFDWGDDFCPIKGQPL